MVQFPIDFKNTEHIISAIDFESQNPKEICLYVNTDKDKLMEKINEDFFIREITFNGQLLYIALKGFKDKQFSSRSAGSTADYLATCKCKGFTLLLQYLPAGGRTSVHYHKKTTEIFHNLYGSATLFKRFENINDNIVEKLVSTLAEYNNLENEILWVHYIEANLGEDSLVLVNMLDPDNTAGMTDHFYYEGEW